MAHRTAHPIPFLALIATLLVIGGCSSGKQVAFTNATDTWLDVRVFVASPDLDVGMTMDRALVSEVPAQAFVSEARHQVAPGDTLRYALSWNPYYAGQPAPLVHVLVEPRTPSWMPADQRYWLELLTPPPLQIVATEGDAELRFDSGGGTVALIPEHELAKARFRHDMVSAQEAMP